MASLLPFALALGLASAAQTQPAPAAPPPNQDYSAAVDRAPAQLAQHPLSPELEARVHALGKQLRCAVCQGVSIADSPAQMARAQYDRVRELVAEGKSDEEIRQYFVERYGEWALLEPPARTNPAVYVLPVLLVLLGGWVVMRQLRRPVKSGGPPAAGGAAKASDETEDPYLRAVRDEMER